MFTLSQSLSENNSLSVLTQKKKQSNRIAFLYDELGEHSKAEKIRMCNSHPIFKYQDNKLKFLTSLFCRQRMCPTCAYVRSHKVKNNVLNIINSEEFKNCNYIFITLTVKNCYADDLNNQIDIIFQAMRKLTSNKNSFFKNYFNGMFYALEITYNKKANTYHPHIHAICSYYKGKYAYRKNIKGKRIEIEQLTKKWSEALGVNYLPSVSIKTVYNTKYKQVSEVAKYTVKGSDIKNKEVLQIIDNAIFNRRLVSYQGLFKTVKHNLKLDDEIDLNKKPSILADLKNPNIAKVVYKWDIGFKTYKIENIVTGLEVSEEELINNHIVNDCLENYKEI